MVLAKWSRSLAVVAMAATLALTVPGIGRALPPTQRDEPRDPLQQFLSATVTWIHSLIPSIWEAGGSGLDPDGLKVNGFEPGDDQTDSDSGSGLNPDGRT